MPFSNEEAAVNGLVKNDDYPVLFVGVHYGRSGAVRNECTMFAADRGIISLQVSGLAEGF